MKKMSNKAISKKQARQRRREKQSIFAGGSNAKKKGLGRRESRGRLSNISVSQSSRPKAAITLADECDFRTIEPSQVEACCLYEYFRESAAMRDAFKPTALEPVPTDRQGVTVLKPIAVRPMPLKGYRDQDVHDYVRLRAALMTAGFPVPWNRLSSAQRRNLSTPLYSPDGRQYFGTGVLDWELKDTDKHPALLVKEFSPGHDPVETDYLLKQWKQEAYYDAPVGRPYFFGVFRLDEIYNETEAAEAFKTWFRQRYGKSKSGGRSQWEAKLKSLVVMRIWKREHAQWKRLKLVQEFCGYKGCEDEWTDYQWRCGQGRGDEPMSKAAKVEMSSARTDARNFFQRLFPDELPLSW